MTHRSRRRVIAATCALAGLLAACGSDDDEGAADTAADTPAETTAGAATDATTAGATDATTAATAAGATEATTADATGATTAGTTGDTTGATTAGTTGGTTDATTAGTTDATTAGTTAGTTGETTAGTTGGTAATAAGGSIAPSTGEPIRVAAVLPSAANDLAFSQSMADALNVLEEAGYISEIALSENMFVVEEAAAAIRDYASQDYDLVIAHGSQYGSLLQEIAPDFPEIAFAWGTASDTFGLENVSGYSASSDEGAYVMGRMAAMMTESEQIGIIGPIEVGDGKLYADGFEAGVASVDDAIDVQVNWTDSFSDVALAAEAATSFIGAGADVLTGSSQMTVGAIGVANESDVLWFGTDANQTQLAPDIVVANQVYHWEVVLADLISGIQEGDLGGDAYDINLGNGGERIEMNEDFDLPDDVQADADATIAGLADGSIETGISEG